jgi:uncharacterized protein (DUF433 family)
MTTLTPETLTGWNRDLIVEDPENPYRSRIAGTGIKIYLVYSDYRWGGNSWEHLCETYNWLSHDQLRAAIGYAFELLPDIETYWQEEDERAAAAMLELWLKSPINRPPRLRNGTLEELTEASKPPK